MDGNLLIITGQTATGKTGLALSLAQEFPIEIISADARQMYQEMDIGTGKIGSGDQLTFSDNMWHLNSIPIHGINLIAPDQTYSSIQFATYARQKIAEIYARKHIPMIVGGTAFYLTSLLNPHAQQYVPPNVELRNRWHTKEKQLPKAEFVSYLQTELHNVDPHKLNSMNESDRANPRRLMRAIEIATAPPAPSIQSTRSEISAQLIALHAPLTFLEQKITQRVTEMFALGLESEIANLIQTYSWQSPGLQTIGYYEWQDFFNHIITHDEVKQRIIVHNRQYARKQTMFLKRLADTKWFDISDQKQKADLYASCRHILKKATISP